MRKLRTKIIAVLILAVFLPVIPLSLLVSGLVNQSYRIGVNPQVAQALENGVFFSKALYDWQRRQLALLLEEMAAQANPTIPGRVQRFLGAHPLLADSATWRILGAGYADAAGRIRWQRAAGIDSLPAVDPRLFSQVSPSRPSLIVSDRRNNLFIALRRLPRYRGYLYLAARLNPEFLQRGDQTLRVYQIFRTLDLNRHSFPHRFLIAFVALTLLLLTLTVLAGIWISGRLTAPLTLLVKGTEEIGRGNLDYRLPLTRRRDETARLMRHFNLMAEALQQNQRRLIYLEKMALWQQIARKLAHEIKNPLTPIQLTLQQLVDQYDDSNPAYRALLNECSQIINEEIGSLRRLVSEFSEFGRLPEADVRPNDLRKLLREIALLYTERVRLNLTEPLPEFPFDYDRLRRVLINLVENALQADTGGHPVEIGARMAGGLLRLTVRDHGPGIPKELRDKIFEPYFTTKKSGMGLGLAITRLIVEEHGGSIRLESAPGKGSTFVIELPAAPGQEKAAL